MLHRNDYAFDCGVKLFFHKTLHVMVTYLVNGTSDINGLTHVGKTIIVINKIVYPKYDRLVPSAIEFYRWPPI